MTSFYARIWIYVGLPILLIMVAMRMRPNADLSNLPVAQLAGAVCGFMLLTYFYQWPETRFTLIYYPVVLLMVVSRAKVARWSDWKEPKRSLDRVCMLVATVIVMAQILFVPLDAWKMKSIRFRPAEFWMVGLLRARPVDRFQIAKSGAEDFAVAQIPKDADAYAARILEAYAAHRKRSVCFSPTE